MWQWKDSDVNPFLLLNLQEVLKVTYQVLKVTSCTVLILVAKIWVGLPWCLGHGWFSSGEPRVVPPLYKGEVWHFENWLKWGSKRFLLRKGGVALVIGGTNARQYLTLLLIIILIAGVTFLEGSWLKFNYKI